MKCSIKFFMQPGACCCAAQAERDTIKEREALEREEELAIERERQRLEVRKLQTKEIVVDTIAKEEAAARAAAEVCAAFILILLG